MNITYQREVSHCQPTTYIKEVTIKAIKDANNSDFLERILFKEIGWEAIAKKGTHKEDDKVFFIPPESVLPVELSDELEVTKYLSKGRVKVVKFRGNRSEGLIVPKEIVEPYIPYIMKWEDPPTKAMGGDGLALSEVSPHFHKFYKMENLLNNPDIFEPGEELYISEKIHGINARFSLLQHPETGEYQLYVGSHNVVLKDTTDTIYWRVAKTLNDRLQRNIVFFGEIFGKGIQHLNYDVDLDVRIFAATRQGEYLSIEDLIKVCKLNGLPIVNFHKIKFESVEQLRKLAESPSEYTFSHIREGIVCVSKNQPDKMAKVISFKYLTSQKRSERH